MDRSSIVWVTLEGVFRHRQDESLPADVGAKARGLLWLPSAWVPPFLVISPDFFAEYRRISIDSRLEFLRTRLRPLLREAKTLAGIADHSAVMLRSNAVKETVEERGRYVSASADATVIVETLHDLYAQIESAHPTSELGIVVQELMPVTLKGHLSNERRAAEEYRDGLIEIEDSAGNITGRRVSYRRWRRGKPPTLAPLVCRSQDDIVNSLRPVLAFAAQERKRVLFEWVWDGQFVHVVQADIVHDKPKGISPDAPLRGRVYTPVLATSLSAFVPVRASASSSTGKLRNHAIYAESGFWQPTFYELTDQRALSAIIESGDTGFIDDDLRILTQRPLVIRTSCVAGCIPLLPRSDLLTSLEAARTWLRSDFAPHIRERGLASTSISLLAHHYIPARAAAFSMGSHNKLDVQIASLWGIPEGLYYYPFDSYLVQTLGVDPRTISSGDHSRFAIVRRRRYKSHFVAPNEDGVFIRHEVSAPWDWKHTIPEANVLAKMAAFTRLLAQREGHPINLMWFVGCEENSGTIDAVPWYHEKFDAGPEEVAFQRNARDEELVIATEEDVLSLEDRARAHKGADRGRRLVIRLFPADDRAIRNEDFAKRVGEAGKSLDAVVVLSGATLSHIYFVLVRTGVHLSVLNRADMSVRSEVHEKLVRDRVPETVAATGETARVARLNKEQVNAALRLKLVEEAFEVRDAGPKELADELADVLEVVRGLATASGIGLAAVERARKRKVDRRGAFKGGLVLLATGGVEHSDESAPLIENASHDDARVVTAATAPILDAVRMGPVDVRDTPEFVEHVQSATVPLTHPEWTIESPLSAELPEGFAADTISWSIDGRRTGTNLQLRIKIRIGTIQLELPLEHDPSGTEPD